MVIDDVLVLAVLVKYSENMRRCGVVVVGAVC
jgi:hypothetical protein